MFNTQIVIHVLRQAYDLGDDPKDQGENERRDFSVYPHVQAEARLGVITVPKIKVFPLATTLVQVNLRAAVNNFFNHE